MSRQPVANPRMFRPTDAESPYPHYLYRLFAADGTLLYIGVTEDVEQRVDIDLDAWVESLTDGAS